MTTNYETSTQAIVGKTIEKAGISKKYRVHENEYDVLILTFTDGDGIMFYHDQDCCERVIMTKYNDLENLNGLYVKTFDKIAISDDDGDEYDSKTVTKLIFNDEFIIEWIGTSNGYYNEGVQFKYIDTEGKYIDIE